MKKLAIVLTLLTSAAGAHPENTGSWARAAESDVRAAYSIYRENHPGWFDPTNRGFRAQLSRARAKALVTALRAHSYAEYADALGTFSAVLQDGHARLVIKPPSQASAPSWPGFITAWRGQSLLVQSRNAPNGAEIGDRILACDGVSIRRVIAARLWTRGMRLHEAGHWWARSPQALIDTPTMNTARPRSCEFAGRFGVRARRLTWVTVPPDISYRLRAAANGERTPIGLTQPRPGLFLIGLPDFNPDEAGVAAYHNLFAEVAAQRSALHHARAIILDLRWNDGGSSEWPRTTAELLWGKNAVDARMNAYLRNVQIWWRASRANAEYIEESASKGAATDPAEQRLTNNFVAASRAGKTFYIESVYDRRLNRVSPDTDLETPVYVIVPGGCASACLDALDTFKRFSNVKLIGAPSAGDTLYVDARAQDLPSGKGTAVIPLKIWMNRPRKSGQVYRPDIEIDELNWSTEHFLDAVEGDLRLKR